MPYYYKIYRRERLPKGRGLVHQYLLLELFKGNPSWVEAKNNWQIQYSNYRSPVSNHFPTVPGIEITNKAFLSKILAGQAYYPQTILFYKNKKPHQTHQKNQKSGKTAHITHRIEFLDSRAKKIWNNNLVDKYFIKPARGHGSYGIQLADRPRKILSPAIYRSLPFGTHLIQQSVQDPQLFEGNRKFEIRVYLLFVFQSRHKIHAKSKSKSKSSKGYQIYLYQDGSLRISAKEYQKSSFDPKINITNSWHHFQQQTQSERSHEQQSSKYITAKFSTQPFYEDLFPKIKNISKHVIERFQKYLMRSSKRGFELMGFDFIPDQSGRPHLIEINRHLGYPISQRSEYHPDARELIHQMFKEIISGVLEPLIDGHSYLPDQIGQWQLLRSF